LDLGRFMSFLGGLLVFAVLAGCAAGQEGDSKDEGYQTDKRIFGVLPNHRTAEGSKPFEPISTKQKFTIAYKDSFDWPVYILSGAFAALYHLEDQNHGFGQGLQGYTNRYVRAYGDQMIGNMMTEAIMPSLLREDPRYFRRGAGKGWARARYALTRVFVTRTDSGGQRFNFSELLGNASAVAVANAYYPETRNVSDNAQKLGIQLATDSFSNVLKEFWPDIRRKLFHRRSSEPRP
jgi:hypothetical protein